MFGVRSNPNKVFPLASNRDKSGHGTHRQHELRSGHYVLGHLPKRLVIARVDSDAVNGTIGKNPFDFKHYKINLGTFNLLGSLFLVYLL
jgi:hypothetical protein